MSRNAELNELRSKVMGSLHESGLENVCDSAYALKPGFTPNYRAMTLELPGLPGLAGTEVRIVGEMVARENVGYSEQLSGVHVITRRALRALMVGMRDQAQAWLDANPEVQP